MPHLNIEYSKNLSTFNPRLALQQLNNALIESGHFAEGDIQSRAMGFDDFLIGNVDEGRAFIHIKLQILSGRSPEVKKALSEALLQALKTDTPQNIKLLIRTEIIDIDRPSYCMLNIGS
ncbi:5-carboxymethyl-2-hydroxymuconate Delta-isomerase [Iodobacter sp. HSC-16F04]|uniref:5-carboxymethyl-2-hydroxymuconate Delta-isomerase n=1 Tax=Iodobacter violaceini TaxID=3044271 RepID=A0ABX0KRM1_9NEIS|nr:5-carboxymethyl-2-hydroxymuconate Delta-isomerase [Iodobacter violacea]NHQ87290.1 5-carboxymethyl-2-hydroxymuconate Delta-isomerase [Iodobacter violacea]